MLRFHTQFRHFRSHASLDPGRIQPAGGELFAMLGLLLADVRQPQMQAMHVDAVLGKQFRDSRAGTAGDGVLLHRDQQPVAVGQLQDQQFVEGLDEAHVGDGEPEPFADLLGGGHPAAERKQGDVLALSEQLTLADGQGLGLFVDRHTGAGAARVAHQRGAGVLVGGGEQLPAFVLIGRGGDDQIGQRAGIAQVEAAGMGSAVGADQPGAVDGEGDVEPL